MSYGPQALLGKLGIRGMRARPETTINRPVGEYLREQLDTSRPDGSQGAALAQGLAMLDSIRPEDPLGWLSNYLRDPTSEQWTNQAHAARQQRAASMSVSATARREVNSVEYLGRLRPHLHAALRSLVDTRPQNPAMTLSDLLGGHSGAVPSGNSDATTEEPTSDGGTNTGSNSVRVVDGDQVVE